MGIFKEELIMKTENKKFCIVLKQNLKLTWLI